MSILSRYALKIRVRKLKEDLFASAGLTSKDLDKEYLRWIGECRRLGHAMVVTTAQEDLARKIAYLEHVQRRLTSISALPDDDLGAGTINDPFAGDCPWPRITQEGEA